MPPATLRADRTATVAGRSLAAMLIGFPLWWALGVASLLPMVVALAMLWDLRRRRERVRLPPGAVPWCCFLLCVLAGVFLLASDAPGSVTGGFGGGRLLVFGFRLAWYLTCTIVVVWVVNASRTRFPDQHVRSWVTVLFAVTVCGGLVGTWWPSLEFTSLLEWVLPRGLRANTFVHTLVHPEVADIQSVLGAPEARPKAPFTYTNTWGSVLALSMVFAVTWAVAHPRGPRSLAARIGVTLAVGIALIPAIRSLNRGLWACLAVFALGGFLLAVRRGHARIVLTAALAAIVFGVLLLGPLVSIVEARFEHQHSNDRRGGLATLTIDSVSRGSPVVGFGSTRDVQGSFGSIAGGATPDCPACGVPSMGTQGQLWLVLFSQGWLGLVFFLSALACALARCWRCRTPNQTLATFVLAGLSVQIFVYDTLGIPLLLVAVAVGLVAREQRDDQESGVRSTAQLVERVKRVAPASLALLVIGGSIGALFATSASDSEWTTRVHIALTLPPDPYLVPAVSVLVDEEALTRREVRITLDTEAALLLSEQTLGDAGVRPDGITLAAARNTQILFVTVRADSAQESTDQAQAVVRAYLGARQTYVDERRADVLTKLREDLRRALPSGQSSQVLINRLTAADVRLRATPDEVGRIVVVDPAEPVPSPMAVYAVSGAVLGALLGMAVAGALRRPRRHSM